MSLLTERYADKISDVLSCYDRILIQGTLPNLCYAKGMTNYLNFHHLRIFDYPRWAEPLREQIGRMPSGSLFQTVSRSGSSVRTRPARKRLWRKSSSSGDKPGWVQILSAMESCQTYKPWHDKQSGKTYLKPVGRKRKSWPTSSIRPVCIDV